MSLRTWLLFSLCPLQPASCFSCCTIRASPSCFINTFPIGLSAVCSWLPLDFLWYLCARTLAYVNFHKIGPFHDIYIGGRHIHHLVWGILILLGVGFGWLQGVGVGGENSSPVGSRLMSFLYGAGAALTLDEFALWLNLEDVYWAREGRASIDAIDLFGTFLIIALYGGRFFHAVVNDLILHRKRSVKPRARSPFRIRKQQQPSQRQGFCRLALQ
jgi:hypothetical protein